jgi:ribosomal protein S18 acetylase RimI-like enzyme
MPPFSVSPAAPHELLPACRLLFAAGHAEHSRDWLLTEGGTSGLFVARDAAGRLHATVLVQVLSGALGVALVPRGDSDDAVDAVATAACAWLRERGVKVCQAFVAAGELADVAALERRGFRHVTRLVFLRREVGPEFGALTPLVRWSPWAAEPTRAQLELLLATHEGTLDCPELNDARTADEILAGFRPTDTANRSWWNARDEGGTLVGVVLVVGGGDGALEVSYLGLVPSARGRGLAGALLQFADQVARLASSPALTVSVDARNTPAMKLYARHGFVEYDRREVWLASWPT